MKMNYRRKDKSYKDQKVDKAMQSFSAGNNDGFSASAYIGNDFCGSAGMRRAVKGAKQHLRHELRRFNKRLSADELKDYFSELVY